MLKQKNKIGIISTVLALIMLGSSSVFALPTQSNMPSHRGLANGASSTATPNITATGKLDSQTHLQAAQLKMCQKRQTAISNIMSRIDMRAQNQITLFSTIASRVEAFYTKKSKTVSNYNTLVGDISTAKTQTESDLSTMKANDSFNCSVSNPRGIVSSFQGYLKQEISDLQSYRTSVKNLIVAVAIANGVTISNTNSSHSSGSTGGQQ